MGQFIHDHRSQVCNSLNVVVNVTDIRNSALPALAARRVIKSVILTGKSAVTIT